MIGNILAKIISNHKQARPWVGFDLDGTLAEYDEWDPNSIGKPVPKIMNILKAYLDRGMEVKIFTARAYNPENIPLIQRWLEHYGLGNLEITCKKDPYCKMIYDDRAVQVERNTGVVLGNPTIIDTND